MIQQIGNGDKQTNKHSLPWSNLHLLSSWKLKRWREAVYRFHGIWSHPTNTCETTSASPGKGRFLGNESVQSCTTGAPAFNGTAAEYVGSECYFHFLMRPQSTITTLPSFMPFISRPYKDKLYVSIRFKQPATVYETVAHYNQCICIMKSTMKLSTALWTHVQITLTMTKKVFILQLKYSIMHK